MKRDKRGASRARLLALRKKYHLGEFSRGRRRTRVLARATSREANTAAVGFGKKDTPPRGKAKKPLKRRVPAVPWRWRYHPNPDPQQPPVPWQV